MVYYKQMQLLNYDLHYIHTYIHTHNYITLQLQFTIKLES